MSTKATIILLATLLLGLSPLAINAQDFEGLNYYQLEDGRYVYYEGLVPCGKEVFIGSDALGDYNGISTVHLACQFCHLFAMLSAIISFLLVELVPILAVILLVAGGIMYYLALGNPEKLSRANKMLKSTIIGLVIVYGAWMIVGAFLTIIGVADWTGLQDGWYTVSCPIKEVGYTVDARPRLLVEVKGRGTVASVTPSDLDIKCGLEGTVCAKFVDEGTAVKLEATADSGGSFKGWRGACKGSGDTCEITMDESKLVTAEFSKPPQKIKLHLTIHALNSGLEGEVTDGQGNTCRYSYDEGQALSKSCTMLYVAGAEVTLTVKPGANTQFAGWFGDACDMTGDENCTFVVTKDMASRVLLQSK